MAPTRPTQPATARVDACLHAVLPALQQEAFPAGTRVLVGVSGGQDSLCLVHALWRLRPAHGWMLHVVHVDHSIRPAAAAEAAQVAAWCAAWGLPAEVVRVDVPAYRRRARLNLQQAARYARYQAFAHCAVTHGAAGVLVAHTADDVGETLLLHLLRGAGLDGLAAPPLVQALPRTALGPPLDARPLPSLLRVGRPLLAVTRADTAAYCAEHGLTPFAEPAAPYRRDRLRRELLPVLEQYNPAVRRALARAAVALREEREALEWMVDRLWPSVASPAEGAVAFALPAWEALPAGLRKRLLRRGAARLAGAEVGLSERALAAALRLARARPGRAIDLPAGLRLERDVAVLRLVGAERRAGEAAAPASPTAGRAEWPLAVPGTTVLPGLGTFYAERTRTVPPAFPPGEALECWLDAAVVREPLVVRFRRPGDRFHPLGLPGAQRLQDFLVNARVPRAARDRLPLVVAGSDIVWVVGRRIAHWARVRPETQEALHLRFEPAVGSEALTPPPGAVMGCGDARAENAPE
jgi:tRNA(Ile)-lysidine synthetase-like protein